MKTWKIILAALVIFAAGIMTGAVVVWKAQTYKTTAATKPPTNPPSPWVIHRPDFLELMKRELALTPAQEQKVAEAISISRQRTDFLWEMLKEPLQEELRTLKNNILAELNPEQQKKFEELIKPRGARKPGEPGHRWGAGREDRQRPAGQPTERDRRPEGPPPGPPPWSGRPPAPPRAHPHRILNADPRGRLFQSAPCPAGGLARD